MTMKTVNVAALKSGLSHYLATVRKGEEVVVTSHNHPVARLVPYENKPGRLEIIPATRPLSDIAKIKGIKLKKPFDPVADLRADRDRR
jgi:prevent-host-death family protein